MKNASDVLKMIKDKDVKFVDFRFTDTKGKMQHVTAQQSTVDEGVSQTVTPSTVPPSQVGRGSNLPTCC